MSAPYQPGQEGKPLPLAASAATAALLGKVRHQLRTPLNAITGYSELLIEEADDRGLIPYVADLEKIRSAGAHLLAFVNTSLAQERFASGTVDFEAVGAGIQHGSRTLINAIVGYTEMLLEDLEEQEDVVADLQKIHQAAARMLAYTADIPKLARALAETAPAPAAAASHTVAAPSPSPIPRGSTGRLKASLATLLVVDDQEANRDLLTRRLEQAGYTVVAAESGERALQLVSQQGFDLVLLDMIMPGMSGYDVCSHLKESPATRDLPVIFVSALDEAMDKVRAFEVGGSDYVTKPFQFEEVLARVANQLKIHRLQKEMEWKNRELARKNEELVQSQRRAERIFSALADVLPGTVLDGKYRLGDKIGAGGFGAVYRATHLTLNRPVAVKVFRPKKGDPKPEDVERFQREGASTCRVSHPNAVAVLDSGVSSTGISYLVMELLEGRSLNDELKEHGMLSPRRSAEIIVPVAEVLAEAHAQGIIHRDVKPDNVFLHQGRDGEVVKVVDFGIAKIVDEDAAGEGPAATVGMVLGTPSYMSPERLGNMPYDGKTDVYSLGIMLYQLLTGSVPFKSERNDIWSVAIMHLTQEPKPLRERVPEVPQALEALVLKMLAKMPSERPSMADVAQQLSPFREQ